MNPSIKKNTVLNIIKTCSSILYPLITFPYVSRVLLPDNVGKVNFAQSFVSYFFLIAMLGIQTYAIRECATVKDDKDKLGNVASQIISINTCSSVVAYFLLAVTLVFFRQLDNYRTLIVIESFTIAFSSLGADWLNSAMEDYKYITLRTICAQILAIIAMLVFVRTQDDYIKYAIICVMSSSGANLLNILYRRRYCRIRFTFHIEWKKHLTPVLLLFVMTLAQTIMSNTDATMLGLMRSDYEVGLYSTAHKITRLVSQIVSSLALVIIPRLSVYFSKNDFENANRLLRKVLLFNITIGLPCVVGVEWLADDIVHIVGGAEFSGAAPVMRVLILSFMFSLVGGSFLGNAILIPMKNEKYYMIVCLITAASNIVLNALFIPILGATGASIATAFNGLLVFLLLLIKIDKRIKIPDIKGVFIGPIVGCVAISICCYLLSFIQPFIIRVVLSIGICAIVYSGVLVFLKNDFALQALQSIKRKVKRGA